MGNYFNKMSNKVRDESFSIDLPLSNIVLTRYLYLKDEVKLAFLVSLLNKSDDAIFWAYELYYSGFKMEFFDYIWTIYYDFFATLNPSFEQYLNKMLNFDKKSREEDIDKLVSAIVQDLLIRPFNTDIFFLRTICRLFEIECSFITTTNIGNTLSKSTPILYEQLTNWIDTKDFKSIAQYILNVVILDTSDKVLYFIYNVAIDVFSDVFNVKLSKAKLLKEFGVAQERLNINNNFVKKVLHEKKTVLLTKIMTLFSLKEKLVKGKNFYIVVVPEDIIQYETIEVSTVKHYKVLNVARICGIDDLKHLSLFCLERDTLIIKDKKDKKNIKEDTNILKDMYFKNWLYHASFSPVWLDRIRKYRGYVDYTKICVEFVDEDLMQLFYLKYGYEPDEQSQNTTDKCLKLNDGINWQTFHDKFKANSLFVVDEELIEELNNDKIRYPF